MEKEKKFKQGRFKPKYPEKYMGNPENIIFRSGWEYEVMKSLDENTSVLKWSSEEIFIPYISPVDNRVHRYFVDFYLEAKALNGDIKKLLVEVKPSKQTQPPKSTKRKTQRYLGEVMTYGVNQAKWEAASKFCDKNGWEFQILTEKDIFPRKK